MITLLIVIAVVAALYLYATIAFYYGFRKWHPLCGSAAPAMPGKRIRPGFLTGHVPRKTGGGPAKGGH